MRILGAVVTAAVVLAALPGLARASTRGECEASLKQLADAEGSVRPQFAKKFERERRRALDAQKNEDYKGCVAAASAALSRERPAPPTPGSTR